MSLRCNRLGARGALGAVGCVGAVAQGFSPAPQPSVFLPRSLELRMPGKLHIGQSHFPSFDVSDHAVVGA